MTTAKDNNLSASLEDYLEAIYNLAGEQKVARSTDIAKTLNVAKPSVTGALKVLAKKGLVNYKPYGYVTLTASGISEAARVAKKHKIIESFFINILGVESKTAQEAACKVEHALGPTIISKLADLTDFATQNKRGGRDLAQEFKQYVRKTVRNRRRHTSE